MQHLRDSPITRTALVLVTACLIAAIALGALLYYKRAALPDMELAAWGALLAGMAGVFAFIFLSAGFWLQKSALEQQELAMYRLALALESQSDALMAAHEPALESSTLLVTDDRRMHEVQVADRIELTLVNTGGDARDLRVRVCGMESLGPPHRTRDEEAKVQRHPNLSHGNPPWVSSWFHYREHGEPPDSRPQGLLIAQYRDAYGIERELRFKVHWTLSPYTDPPFAPSKYGILLRVAASTGPVDSSVHASMPRDFVARQ